MPVINNKALDIFVDKIFRKISCSDKETRERLKRTALQENDHFNGI
ncbi:MAG: hypothetical protein ACTS77_04235 [Arsenophonus sp. NC-TX2-MAG3]